MTVWGAMNHKGIFICDHNVEHNPWSLGSSQICWEGCKHYSLSFPASEMFMLVIACLAPETTVIQYLHECIFLWIWALNFTLVNIAVSITLIREAFRRQLRPFHSKEKFSEINLVSYACRKRALLEKSAQSWNRSVGLHFISLSRMLLLSSYDVCGFLAVLKGGSF